jgi:hypothetical protein
MTHTLVPTALLRACHAVLSAQGHDLAAELGRVIEEDEAERVRVAQIQPPVRWFGDLGGSEEV